MSGDGADEPDDLPCLQIQVDLSAMVDGELDAAGVRRVLVHADLCATCRAFLDGVRAQVRVHRAVAAAPPRRLVEPSVVAGLRDQLTKDRRKLSRVLYELGRGFVLMGLSPEFSREVAKEPVPVPDMAQKGRNLLDEVARRPAPGSEGAWIAAKDLFDATIRSARDNLAQGERLLRECLALDAECHEARIYLGLGHHVAGRRHDARREFQHVLVHATDRRIRGFALLNLGNLMLDEGDADGAVDLLLQLVDSGAIAEQPQLGTAYFNLGLAHGFAGRYRESAAWFRRMADEMPHKQSWMRRELAQRHEFVALLRGEPAAKVVAEAFPGWFG
ncbi:MAG: hypothetical protein ACK6D1_05180 [Planctomycetota bacterium]